MEIGKLLFIRRLRELATLIRMTKQGEAAVAADGWTERPEKVVDGDWTAGYLC